MINNCVLQGDTWESLLASVQVETIGKDCVQAGHNYLYKGRLPVGFLGLVDDIVGVTETGIAAQKMTSLINLKTAEKKIIKKKIKEKALYYVVNKKDIKEKKLNITS